MKDKYIPEPEYKAKGRGPFLTASVDLAYGLASSLRDLITGVLRSYGGASIAAVPPGQLVATG